MKNNPSPGRARCPHRAAPKPIASLNPTRPHAQNILPRLLSLALLFLLALPVFAANDLWLTDFSTAKKQAKTQDKQILALFTGSDWCPYCIQWEKEVFTKPEFLNFATNKYVLLLVDFPEKKKLPKAQLRANETLKDRYDVEEYPMVYILNSAGKEQLRTKYLEGGLAPLTDKLASVPAPKTAK